VRPIFRFDRGTLLYWGNRSKMRPRAKYFVLCNDRGTLLYWGNRKQRARAHQILLYAMPEARP